MATNETESPALVAALEVTIYARATDNRGKRERLRGGWSEFCEELRGVLQAAEATDKKALPAIGPHVLRAGTTRGAGNVEHVTLAALDVDRDLPDVGVLLEALRRWKLAAIVHGSPSDPAPTSRKVRAYLPVTRPIAPAECAQVRRALAQALGVTVDASTLDPSRLFFAGRLKGTPAREVWETEGEPLDVEDLLRAYPEAARSRPSHGRERSDPQGADPDVIAPLLEQLAEAIEPAWSAGDRQSWFLGFLGWLHGKHFSRAELTALVDSLPDNDHAHKYRAMPERLKALDGPSEAVREALGDAFDDVDALVSQHPNNPAERMLRRQRERHATRASSAPASEDEHPLIVQHAGHYWLRERDANHYERPIVQQDLVVSLNHLHGDHDESPARLREGGKVRKVTDILLDYGSTPAKHLALNYAHTATTWDPETQTLTEGYRLPPIEPAHDIEVEAWLRAMVRDGLEELYDWIASTRIDRLVQLAAALALVGPPGIGKSLLFLALARLWGETPSTLKAAVAQFNATIARCPIWLDDECVALKDGDVSSERFRELVQQRVRDVEPKGKERRKLHGAARLGLTANDIGDIRFEGVGGPGAVQAVADRLAIHHTPDSDRERVIAKLARLRVGDGDDVDVDRIARHLAWVQQIEPRVQRFLGGRADNAPAIAATLAGHVARHTPVFELARAFLEQPEQRSRDIVRAKAPPWLLRKGLLHAHPKAIADAAYMGRDDGVERVHRALAPFRLGERVQARAGGRDSENVWWWPLDTARLAAALDIPLGG